MLIDNIGLLRLSTFNRETVDQARKALNELDGLGAAGLVIDLRGNTGGPESEMSEFADLFIGPDQVLWLSRPLDGRFKRTRSQTEAAVRLPIIVLVDGKTAGGELVAAAIKRNKRGKLVGQKTSGLVSGKKLVEYPDGSSEHVVQCQYFIKRRTPITGRGVTPDVPMPLTATPEEVLEKAIEVLKAELE